MKKAVKFLILELSIFILMGVITILEIANFKIFETFFSLIKNSCSWFVGLSLAYSFSSLIQKPLLSLFSKKVKEEERKRGDFFLGFLITLIITALITPFIKEGVANFLGIFFIYFHIILMQSLIVLYLLFKIKGGYEISGKYFLTNEAIVFFYTVIVLYSVV